MTRLLRFALLLLLACAPAVHARSKLMAPAADQAPRPEPGKALVVFLRPSFVGGAIASTVYDAPDNGDTFLARWATRTGWRCRWRPARTG